MKTAKENFVNVVKNKKILFLENSNGLDNGLEFIEKLLRDNEINHKCLIKPPIHDLKFSKIEWEFYKLSSKAYWDYKNQFDK